MIFLVRHAKAGHRSPEYPDDRLRPLTPNGWAQADALAVTMSESLRQRGLVGPLLSSPYVRCMQTLVPLARELNTLVLPEPRLEEGEPFLPVLDLIREAAAGTVMCSHGDLIPETIEALERRGCDIATAPNWKKGSVWVLERNEHHEVVSAACWPPPDD